MPLALKKTGIEGNHPIASLEGLKLKNSISWGASPAKNGKYVNQIGNPTLRRFNQYIFEINTCLQVNYGGELEIQGISYQKVNKYKGLENV